MKSLPAFARCFLLLGVLALSACDYEFPATVGPTRGVDDRLLGDWVASEKEDNKELVMHVRKLDEFNYAVSVEADIYRAFHSDLGKLSLLSVQDLNSSARKYVLYGWQVSPDGATLTLRRVSTEVIPEKEADEAALQSALQREAGNPKLLVHELVFKRAQPRKF